MSFKISGARDGKEVSLPQDLDAISIQTSKGSLYIDLGSPIPDMVLIRPSVVDGGQARLILSPMEGRMAVGVIKT